LGYAGFCTPGIIVAIYALFANNPTTAYVEEHLDGNLCRCTGYRPIWDAARSLCTDSDSGITRGPCGTACRECPERDECEMDCNEQDKLDQNEEKKSETTGSNTCCSTSDHKISQFKDTIPESKSEWLEQPSILFPKELLLQDSTEEGSELTKPLIVASCLAYHTGTTWFKPTTLIGILDLLKRFGTDGGCKIVVGNTEVGIGKIAEELLYSFFSHSTIDSN
jgi:xanthine dehydrogenase/oxidase